MSSHPRTVPHVWRREPQPWTREGDDLARVERERLDEIRRDNARAAAVAVRCPGCGCTTSNRCVLELPNDGGIGRCASPADLGHEVCSACLTPELRRYRPVITL